MSKINAARRYLESVASVGDAAYVTATGLQLDGTGVAPPGRGLIRQVRAAVTAGPGTELGVRLRQTSDSRVVVDYPLQAAPLEFGDPPVLYEGTLQVEVISDDATAGTTAEVEVVIERQA